MRTSSSDPAAAAAAALCSNFYAVRRGRHALRGAIFLSWDDCEPFVGHDDNYEATFEYSVFDTLEDAAGYVVKHKHKHKNKSRKKEEPLGQEDTEVEGEGNDASYFAVKEMEPNLAQTEVELEPTTNTGKDKTEEAKDGSASNAISGSVSQPEGSNPPSADSTEEQAAEAGAKEKETKTKNIDSTEDTTDNNNQTTPNEDSSVDTPESINAENNQEVSEETAQAQVSVAADDGADDNTNTHAYTIAQAAVMWPGFGAPMPPHMMGYPPPPPPGMIPMPYFDGHGWVYPPPPPPDAAAANNSTTRRGPYTYAKAASNHTSTNTTTTDEAQKHQRLQKQEQQEQRKTRDAERLKKSNEHWEQMYEELVKYKEEHGTCQVPFRQGTDLARWCHRQKQIYRTLGTKGNSEILTGGRIQRLQDLGFKFVEIKNSGRKHKWDEWVELLRKFKDEHGHCRVPKGFVYPPNSTLGDWVSKQRQYYRQYHELQEMGEEAFYNRKSSRKPMLNPQRIAILDEIGFAWNEDKRIGASIKKSWNERFEELVQYKEKHGTTLVPRDYPQLGDWVKFQRMNFKRLKNGNKRTTMTAEKVVKLQDIGFVFDSSKIHVPHLNNPRRRQNEENEKDQEYEEEMDSNDESGDDGEENYDSGGQQSYKRRRV